MNLDKESLPEGAIFKGYRNHFVQDIVIHKKVILYKRAYYELPEGGTISAELPKNLNNQHFGPQLRQYIVYQYHANNVTQPKIREELSEYGIQISAGEINNIILQSADALQSEYHDISKAGLETAKVVGVDDTSARHNGRNGSCLVIQNDFFAHFVTTNSKSRLNFLQTLRGTSTIYVFDETAIVYLQNNRYVKPSLIELLEYHKGKICSNHQAYMNFLSQIGVSKLNTGEKTLIALEEAATLGGAINNDLNPELIIMSDRAGQFNTLINIFCWIHVERTFKRMLPKNDNERKEIQQVRDDIWDIYRELQDYKKNPSVEAKTKIVRQFEEKFQRSVESLELAAALKRMFKQKEKLLFVLEKPFVPLHNNASESAIRCYRIKQKISGSTRSIEGKIARDVFASLIKTCRKLKISAWAFLGSRFTLSEEVPYLSDIIRKQALANPP